jgi:FtsP/CotA-like multicopper oxidase with cupredoxin domain
MSATTQRHAAPWLLALTLAGATAGAEPMQCPKFEDNPPLKEIPVIEAKDHLLSTTLRVETRTMCVPTDGRYVQMDLRTYVYPDPKKPGSWTWDLTGPTLRLYKPEHSGEQGDRLEIKLQNGLCPDHPGCDSACKADVSCPKEEGKLPPHEKCVDCKPQETDCKLCCCWVDRGARLPNCFHGDNTTNLHFHGTHVSPQAPQDYVLLELRPEWRSNERPAESHADHERGEIAYGEYQYKLDPLPWTQAEGTHWYHPHKHGSVALQVANGMAGALLIEGPFDKWLRTFYDIPITERLMVLQEVQAENNLFTPTSPASLVPNMLVNGQLTPKVEIGEGEIQRWRFVNATMRNAAEIKLVFPAELDVRQIAMDGIQFSRKNYDKQPLLDNNDIDFAPGNRVDVLVRGKKTGTYQLQGPVFGNLAPSPRESLHLRDTAISARTGRRSSLITVEVVAPKKRTAANMEFPPADKWPETPDYLKDITSEQVEHHKIELRFSMTAVGGDPTTEFQINGKKYDPSCVDITTEVGTAAEWTLKNETDQQHPFHIHTNPFQVIYEKKGGKFRVWQDTIALPLAKDGGKVTLRQRYEHFTGEYVLHCHFLGHEDRGMMFSVQTICPRAMIPGDWFGTPSVKQPECKGKLKPAAARCVLPNPGQDLPGSPGGAP